VRVDGKAPRRREELPRIDGEEREHAARFVLRGTWVASMNRMRTIRGALLDVDGTLLDSNEAHAAAWLDALREQSVEVTRERVRHLIGMGADNLLPALGLEDDQGPGKRAKERHDQLFGEVWLPRLRPLPGARALVERLRDEGIARIVVTSSRREGLQALLKAAEVDDLIEDTAADEDAPATKPAPDLVHAAIRLSGIPPERLVMLGDTPYDVAAARKAGVRSVGVRSGGFSDRDLEGAAAIYDDAADLLRHFDDSPFGG
jgi:HAD superfamily hydrolase (TIGR01509 family)